MTRQLLDNFFKSRLEKIDYPYSKDNWAKMEKMLTKETMPGKISKTGVSKFFTYYVAAGITIAGVVGFFCITNTNTEKKADVIKVEKVVPVPSVEKVENAITVDNAIEVKPVITKKSKKDFKNQSVVYSTQLESEEVTPIIDVNTMMSSVADEKVMHETLPVEKEIIHTVEKPNTTIENIERTEPGKPKPVPAAELMKKKRGWLYYLGFRRR